VELPQVRTLTLMVYTDEQKAEAVRLYVEVGASAAAREIGCSRDTVYEWLALYPTSVGDEKEKERREARVLAREAKREAARDAMLDAWFAGAVTAAGIASDPKQARAYQSLSIGAATFQDKFRLEMGEHTDRTQVVTLGLIEREVERLEAELGAARNG
jgi:transposase-like protein